MPILASPNALTATACPSWCRLPAGHAPEFDIDGTATVVHRAVVLADNPRGHQLDPAPRAGHPLAGPAIVLGAAAFVLGLAWAPILAVVVVLAVLAIVATDAVRTGATR